MNKANILHFLCLTALILSLFALPASADEVETPDPMAQVFAAAETELGYLGADNTLIITDLSSPSGSSVFLDDFYTEFIERGFSFTQNLVKVQNSGNSPLWFAFFNKESGNCTFIELKYTAGESPEIATPITRNIDFEELYSDQAAWSEAMSRKVFEGREFAIFTIANGWTEGLDYELVKCIELHNHFCPGVSSGYILARYMEDNYPLGPGEQYIVFSCPTWCKEDAFVTLWDATPGKRGLWASELTDKEKEALGGSPAGIFVVWNSTAGTGKAVALSFDFDKIGAECGAVEGDAGWASKYLMDVWMLEEENWEGLILETAVLDIDGDTLNELKSADINPYVALGLLNPAGNVNPSGNAIPGIGYLMNNGKRVRQGA